MVPEPVLSVVHVMCSGPRCEQTASYFSLVYVYAIFERSSHRRWTADTAVGIHDSDGTGSRCMMFGSGIVKRFIIPDGYRYQVAVWGIATK